MSISAHKIYAPKGVGALYVRRGVRLHKQNIGGHQERERRGGTENVPQIVAFGKACELAKNDLSENSEKLKNLRDKFEQGVTERIDDIVFNGGRENRIPNISNISFRSIEGEGLLINLDMQGIAVSTGSACSSGSLATVARHPRSRQKRRTRPRRDPVQFRKRKYFRRCRIRSGNSTQSG